MMRVTGVHLPDGELARRLEATANEVCEVLTRHGFRSRDDFLSFVSNFAVQVCIAGEVDPAEVCAAILTVAYANGLVVRFDAAPVQPGNLS